MLSAYGSQGPNVVETIENQTQLMSIMTAYGQSFMLPDINIFQQNLAALDTLHSKWKLYHKVRPFFSFVSFVVVLCVRACACVRACC